MENSKGQEYIPIIWHELRTPLTSMRWYLSMILEWDMGEINDEQRKALNHCYDSSVRMIKLVNDVLTLSKIENWKMEYHKTNVWIVELIKSVYNDIYIEIENKKIDFKINIDKNLKEKEIYIDKDKIKQVLLNLLTNSLKFTKSWYIEIKASLIDNYVNFEIIDTWVWISNEDEKVLFEKFMQVESSMQRQNTAWIWIWLTLVKSFIKDFWSEIKIKSEVWKWSNFSFKIKLI